MKIKTFNRGIEELQAAFPDLGMTKERAEIWYRYSKDLTDKEWDTKIFNCIRGCHRVPTLADILDQKKYYEKEKAPAEYPEFIWEAIPAGAKIPEDIKKQIHKFINKLNLPKK